MELPLLQDAVMSKSYRTTDITGKKKIDLIIWKQKEPQLMCIIGVEGNKG